MPGKLQVSKRFSILRQGWFYIISVIVLGVIRKWLLRKSGPDKHQGKSLGKGEGKSNEHRREAKSAPFCAASEAEMGPHWHFEGRRRWLWMHNGTEPTGWVEFGTEGILRTDFYAGVRGSWKRQTNEEMRITFGNCHHMVFLLPEVQGQPPMFELRERVMKNGLPGRSKNRSGNITRGCLEL